MLEKSCRFVYSLVNMQSSMCKVELSICSILEVLTKKSLLPAVKLKGELARVATQVLGQISIVVIRKAL